MATPHKIVLVADRVARAKKLLLSQFQDSPNINGFLETLIDEVQELEDTLVELQNVNTLELSYGWWLDRIGEELKVERGSYDDNDYKTAIKIAMAKKTSSATRSNILRIVYLLTADESITLTNDYPYLLELAGLLPCVSESEDGLRAIADLFPTNTRVRIVKRFGGSFKFGTVGRGFDSGSTLNSLIYHDYGILEDPRFYAVSSAIVPPTPSTLPFVLEVPLVTGDNYEGGVLSTTDGVWGGNTPITYTYQWLRDNAEISGATNNTYTVVNADVDKNIACRVTATNAVGDNFAISNSILIDNEVPPVSTYTTDLGMDDIYSLVTWSGGAPVTATTTLTVNSDGTTARTNTMGSTNDAWLNVTGAGLGSDYTLEYNIVSGYAFSNLAPNAKHNLGTNISLSQSLTFDKNLVDNHTYVFTIRKISDGSVVQSKQVTFSLEIVDIVT